MKFKMWDTNKSMPKTELVCDLNNKKILFYYKGKQNLWSHLLYCHRVMAWGGQFYLNCMWALARSPKRNKPDNHQFGH